MNNLISRFLRWGLIGIGSLALAGFLFILAQTPSLQDIQKLAMGSDRLLLDRDGRVLQMIRTDFTKRRLPWIPLRDFSDSLKTRVVQIEDKRFYAHQGIDGIALLRALRALVRGSKRQGASTITMQTVDLLSPEVLLTNKPVKKGRVFHKFKQIFRALALEWKWNKEEILEAYLNLIPLKGETQGLPAFSFAYLNKDPVALNEDEATLAAVLISAPNAPLKIVQEKACFWKRRLQKDSPAQCESLLPLIQNNLSRPAHLKMPEGRARHLAHRLTRELKKENIIHSSLDYDLQGTVSEILSRHIERLKPYNVNDGAAIVMDNQTGEVLAYVGAVAHSQQPFVDGVRAPRQAGSALKPFLYARALDSKRITAASILLDDPTILTWNKQSYRPTNYDKTFNGPVSVREALASSLNVPAVKVVTLLGLHATYQVLQDIGLTGLKEPDFYGVSMALGAVEVTLENLTNAYRIFANQGVWSPLTWTIGTNGTFENGIPPTSKLSTKALFSSPLPPKTPFSRPLEGPVRRVFSPAAGYIIGSILSDPNARAMGFAYNSPIETPFWTMVKTGTSKDYRDNWCIGVSEKYTVGVWAGNFNASPMKEVSGVSGAGPVWFEIMSRLHHERPSRPPNPPTEVIAKEVSHPWKNEPQTEWFVEGTEPSDSKIELANNNKISFLFPTEGAKLIKDPYLNSNKIGFSVRLSGDLTGHQASHPSSPLKGNLATKPLFFMDGEKLGEARSPFPLNNPSVGSHRLELRDAQGKRLAQVNFKVIGKQNE